VLLPFQSVSRHLQLGETAQHCSESNLTLKPSKRCTKTEMDAQTETDMPTLIADEVKAVRLRKVCRIAIRRTNNQIEGIGPNFGM